MRQIEDVGSKWNFAIVVSPILEHHPGGFRVAGDAWMSAGSRVEHRATTIVLHCAFSREIEELAC
jgi:hypothetical protein